MKTNDQQYANGVKSGLETKYTNLELREIKARKELNANYKVNLRITDGWLGIKNNLVGFHALHKLLSLCEIEMLLNMAKKQQTDKKVYPFGTGVFITLYVK